MRKTWSIAFLFLAGLALTACGEGIPTALPVAALTPAGKPPAPTSPASTLPALTVVTRDPLPTYDPATANLPDLPCLNVKDAARTYGSQTIVSRKGCLEGVIEKVDFEVQSTADPESIVLHFKDAPKVLAVIPKTRENLADATGMQKLRELEGKAVRVRGYLFSYGDSEFHLNAERPDRLELL